MAEKARNLNPFVALLILVFVGTALTIGGLMLLGLLLHLLVHVAGWGWDIIG